MYCGRECAKISLEWCFMNWYVEKLVLVSRITHDSFIRHYGDTIRALWRPISPVTRLFIQRLVQTKKQQQVNRQGMHKTFNAMTSSFSWWRHQMETFSALLAICAGNSPATGEFPAQRPVTRSFDVFFHLCLNKGLSKQSWGWWFETLSRSLWRHCNVIGFPPSGIDDSEW